MGDRGNIVMKQSDGEVWFYTHWTGSTIQQTLQKALIKGEDRWKDEPYLARIVFCTLVGKSTDSVTRFGITTRITDNEHPILVVDCPKQKIYLIKEEQLQDNRLPKDYNPDKTWSFEEFIKLKLDNTEE